MSFKPVRPSKFRNVFGTAWKREQCYDNIRVSKHSGDSTFCSVNPKFIAIITESAGGGAFIVLPIQHKYGRITPDYPLVAGHRGPVLDVAWCPHNDHVIASGSEDCLVKIWEIPDHGMTRTMTESAYDLVYHRRKVGLVLWHPSAQDVLLTAGSDNMLVIWNVGRSEPTIVIDTHPDLVYSACWNWDGSRFLTTCRDKRIRIFDPRTGQVEEQSICHQGSKASRAIYLRNGLIFTTGFSKINERQYSLRAPEHLNDPIVMVELDTSNGVLFPFYDPDTNMVYLCGKGDSMIRYFEITPDPPFVHYINKFVSPDAQRGICMMPKRGCDVMACEISRFYRLNGSGLCQIISMTVPRKMDVYHDPMTDVVKPEQLQPRRRSIHVFQCDDPPTAVPDKRPVTRRWSLHPADTAPFSTIQVASSTPADPASSLSRLNNSVRCLTSISRSPDLFLRRKASLPPLPFRESTQALNSRRSLTADFTLSMVQNGLSSPSRVSLTTTPLSFSTPDPPRKRQQVASLNQLKASAERARSSIHQMLPMSTPTSSLRLSLDSISISSPEELDEEHNVSHKLEDWPAFESSYAKLMDCELIECCISVHDDLSRHEDQVDNETDSDSPAEATEEDQLEHEEATGTMAVAIPSPELPKPLRILEHWIKVMEEKVARFAQLDQPDQPDQRFTHDRILELQSLRREVESRSSYFNDIEKRYSCQGQQHLGRDLEHRFHQLLLRIMEWSFQIEHVQNDPDPGTAQPIPHDDQLPTELREISSWLQTMEDRVPALILKPKWSRNFLASRLLEYKNLQREVETRSSHIAELAQWCKSNGHDSGTAIETRYHGLLLRIFEWSLHMGSLYNNYQEPLTNPDIQQVPDEDFQLVMEESHSEAELEWDSSGSNDDILPSPRPSSPADGNLPLSMELESCGWLNAPPSCTNTNDIYAEYISNRQAEDDADRSDESSCCSSLSFQMAGTNHSSDWNVQEKSTNGAVESHHSVNSMDTSHPVPSSPTEPLIEVDPSTPSTRPLYRPVHLSIDPKIHSLTVNDTSDVPSPYLSELFQEDLYPDTPCDVAALSADEWFAGRDELPVLMSMKVNNASDKTLERPPAVPSKTRLNRQMPPVRPSKPDSTALESVMEHYGLPSGNGARDEPANHESPSTSETGSGSGASLDRSATSQSHSTPSSDALLLQRIEELIDEIHRLHSLVVQHEERFQAMEARLSEKELALTECIERFSFNSPATQLLINLFQRKAGIISMMLTLMKSPFSILCLISREMPSPLHLPVRAISTARRIVFFPVTSLSNLTTSLLSAALFQNPSRS